MPTPDVAAALQQIAARLPVYQQYEDYYDGRQPLTLANERHRGAIGRLARSLVENLCAGVVDTSADRLAVGGFRALGVSDAEAAAVAGAAELIWRLNRMDRRAGEVHAQALMAGDSYVIVWPDAEGRPELFPNRARQMTLRYSDRQPGRLEWAAKCWPMHDGSFRLTLYYADYIAKYSSDVPSSNATSGGSHSNGAATLPEDADAFRPLDVRGEPWPLPNPWGLVPVVHFANNAGIGEFGRSELRDVIPLQDALNKTHVDKFVAIEREALPQRWATGIEVPTDPLTGYPVEIFTAGAGTVWHVPVPDATFGQFPQTDLAQFLQVEEALRKSIATISRTPLHYLQQPSGQFPSGEALKVAEAPLYAKVRDRQISFGNAWENVLALALRMTGLAVPALMDTIWTDMGPRDDQARATVTQTLTNAGASLEGAAQVAGYTEAEARQLAEVDLLAVTP